MNCPTCGEKTSVLSTRDGTRRRRTCPREHRFDAEEVLVTQLGAYRSAQYRINQIKALVNQPFDANPADAQPG